MLNALAIGLGLICVGTLYFTVLRPILEERGPFVSAYRRADSFWNAVGNWTKGFRTMAAAWIIGLPSALLAVYDLAVPILSGQDLSAFSSKYPLAWPISIALVALVFGWLRKRTDTTVGTK